MAKRVIAMLLAIVALFAFTASAAAPGMEAAAKKVKKIVLDQEGKIELKKGEKYQLTYTLLPEGAESKVTWSTSNKKVAKVNKKGVVTARGEGTAKITVTTKNGKKDTVKIKVTDPTIAKKIIVDEEVKTVVVGEKFTPGYTLVPDTAETKVTIKSNKTKVVKVNKKGVATALKPGTAKLTFTTANGKKDTMKVKVVKAGAPTPAPTAVPTAAPTATPTVAPTATPAPTSAPAPGAENQVWFDIYWMDMGGMMDVKDVDTFIDALNNAPGVDFNMNGASDEIGIAAENYEYYYEAFKIIDPTYEKEKFNLIMAAGLVESMTESATPFAENAAIVVAPQVPSEYANRYYLLKDFY